VIARFLRRKVGLVAGDRGNFSSGAQRQAGARSRVHRREPRRLRVEAVDLYQLTASTPPFRLEDTWGAVCRDRRCGSGESDRPVEVTLDELERAPARPPVAERAERTVAVDARSSAMVRKCAAEAIAFISPFRRSVAVF